MSRSTKREQRAASRAREKEARRLEEREQVSGEIRTPADITAKRARRAAAEPAVTARASQKTPVSSRTWSPNAPSPDG